MKTRIRWYGLGLENVVLRRVAEAMSKSQYTKRRPVGFHLSEVRRDHIVGTFIERLEWEDTVDDPANGALTIRRIEVRKVGFRLESGGVPEVELTDSPRSLKGFVDQFSECLGERVIFSPLLTSPTEWLRELEKIAGTGTVIAIAGSGITLSAATSASLHLEGTEDVRRHLSKLTQGRQLRVERIALRLPSPHTGVCELLTNGRAVVTDGREETVGSLRSALRRAVLTG